MTVERYLAAAPQTLRIAELDGLTAIYHRASAQTHILAEPSPSILAALVAPLSTAQLLDALGSADSEMEALVARLGELEAAGLIERI